ncbi:MAG TPA: glutathione S-transferase family protein [Xanthobacteraceae bacterium]|nr:glutathione S-transferase family protein [Xanthobacteraceae bacterium]
MTDVVVLGFPRSTYVHIVRLVLTHKGIPYTFRDLEPEMGSASHLALHPFDRVPILQHGDFTLYEASAIATYVDEAFEGPPLQPKDVRARARMNQWISCVNSYYYPYMIYHVTHERLVYPQLGIASDEKVVAHALPKIERALHVLETALGHGADYIIGRELTLADFFMLPEHVCVWADRRRQGDVSQISFVFRLAHAHGSVAERQAFSRGPAATRAY